MEHGELTHPNGKKMGQNLAMIGGTPFRDLPGDRARYKENVPKPLSGKLEKIMTEDMKKSEKFKSDHGGEGLRIRTSTSTCTKTVNGKRSVTKTVKTFHNDKCVKISVNGVDQPME